MKAISATSYTCWLFGKNCNGAHSSVSQRYFIHCIKLLALALCTNFESVSNGPMNILSTECCFICRQRRFECSDQCEYITFFLSLRIVFLPSVQNVLYILIHSLPMQVEGGGGGNGVMDYSLLRPVRAHWRLYKESGNLSLAFEKADGQWEHIFKCRLSLRLDELSLTHWQFVSK